VISGQAAGLLRDGPTKRLKKAENMVRNAARIASTLGEMKGAAMKVGQMLSLHEGLLPDEVAAILSVLQNDAPSVSFERMEAQLRRELDNFDERHLPLRQLARSIVQPCGTAARSPSRFSTRMLTGW
jgi:predicted unusual protein kinase regulating ubiquinone biosynthesis (AarF/ABC1/UbiB family)